MHVLNFQLLSHIFLVLKKNNMAVSQQLDLNPTCDQAELRQRIYSTNNLQISYYVMIDVFIVVSLGAYQNSHVMTINHYEYISL